MIARVFGVQETIFVLGSGLGGLLAALAVSLFGLSAALVVTGLVLPVIAVLLRASLGKLEAGVAVPERPFTRLRALAIFAPLPVATIENLATRASSEHHAAGAEIFLEGEDGDRFYVIDEGTVEVVADGRLLGHCEPGECFGEIALDRSDFLAGVSAPARSTNAAQRLTDERLEIPVPTG